MIEHALVGFLPGHYFPEHLEYGEDVENEEMSDYELIPLMIVSLKSSVPVTVDSEGRERRMGVFPLINESNRRASAKLFALDVSHKDHGAS